MGSGASLSLEPLEPTTSSFCATELEVSLGGPLIGPPRAPPAPLATILEGVLLRIRSVQAEATLPPEKVEALKQSVATALERHSAEDVTPLGDAVAEATLALSEHCLAAVSELGLSSAPVAELLCEALAATAALGCEGSAASAQLLEPLGSALDGFAMQILATLWRLDEVVAPKWNLQRSGQGGQLVFAKDTMPFLKHALDLRLYQALQGVCIWVLALAVRTTGHSNFASLSLWEFCSEDPLSALVFAKGALCFEQGERETSCVRVPHDLPELRDAILGALLGLGSQDIVFLHDGVDAHQEANMDIAERNKILMRHHAILAAVAADNGLVDCLLAYPWAGAGASRLSAFSNFLAALVTSDAVLDMAEAVAMLQQQVAERSTELWERIAPHALSKRGFLRDCAELAFAAPPSAQALSALLQRCLKAGAEGLDAIIADSSALAALVALSANAGSAPGSDQPLTGVIKDLDSQAKSQLFLRLQSWRGSLKPQALEPWLSLLGASSPVAAPIKDAKIAAPRVDHRNAGLRELMCDIPEAFRCELDGKLLVDPVRTPSGRVFERSVLVRLLTPEGGVCPISGTPLALGDCVRDPDLRAQIVKWVRLNRPRQKR
ncbi:unnamed protein product [Polarella glacialis]|uniref:U-box domain-containing protein n=1 Tax=Polarella glacialis TaxID=89957 RepID=A0A813JYF9_POLGL|nr:unnamed protein product [Polarella glacialis]